MIKIMTILIVAGLTFTTTTTSNAAIRSNQLNQQRLIDAGYISSQLTYQNRAILNAPQRTITRREARIFARSHEKISKRDRRILNAHQPQAGRDIQREKYDGQRGSNRFKI